MPVGFAIFNISSGSGAEIRGVACVGTTRPFLPKTEPLNGFVPFGFAREWSQLK